MSTKIEFKWKPGEPGELKSVTVYKVENEFTVRVTVWGGCDDCTFVTGADLLRFMSESLCGDIAPAREEVVAEPVPPVDPPPQKFPATFWRFDVPGAEVRAVFIESGMKWSRNERELEERIQWLRVYENLRADELGKWRAVLAELRATKASVDKAAKS